MNRRRHPAENPCPRFQAGGLVKRFNDKRGWFESWTRTVAVRVALDPRVRLTRRTLTAGGNQQGDLQRFMTRTDQAYDYTLRKASHPAPRRRRPTPSSVVGEILGDGPGKKRVASRADLDRDLRRDRRPRGRKLAPALYNVMVDGGLMDPTVIISVSRGAMTNRAFADKLKGGVNQFSRQKLEPAKWDKFASMLDFVGGDFGDDATYIALKARLDASTAKGTKGNRCFYLSTPPAQFPTILQMLEKHKLIEKAVQRPGIASCRVIVEKPFGRDLKTARELNEMISNYVDESQIYRIDHYLGKETVQNILVLRFGNSIFEPIWNRNHIDFVEITAAEEIGIEGRGAFYEQTGVVRDIIQNHLLQVMSLVTMEVPASFAADDIRDEKSQVLRFSGPRELTLNEVAERLRARPVPRLSPGRRRREGLAARRPTPPCALA